LEAAPGMEAAQDLEAAPGMEAALTRRTVLELNKKYLKKNTLPSFGDKTLMADSKLNEIKASLTIFTINISKILIILPFSLINSIFSKIV